MDTNGDIITVEFFIEGLPPSPNKTKGMHWSKLEAIKKEWMERVRLAALQVKREENLRGLYDSADIYFSIHIGDNRRHDPDNLIWSVAKPTLDALTGVFLEDDNIDCITLGFSFDRESPKGFTVKITGV